MQARYLPARTGIAWLKAAYALYRLNPPLLTSITMLYLVLVVGLNVFIPVLGSFLVPLLLPIFNLVMGNACRMVAEHRQPESALLLIGVRERRPQLLRLGLMQVAASMVLVALTMLIDGVNPITDTSVPSLSQMIIMLLHFFVMAAPVMLAFWFAPLLTGWDGVAPVKAVFFSIIACWRNLGAFMIYALCIIAVAILLPGLIVTLGALAVPSFSTVLAFALQTLLIVVVTPILMTGTYISYRDVFHLSETVE
ncbi:MAG TPA: BPSS1780 family membrane protein [Rhodocyclaceae bacterium]|nr:BPSS1780 family membrane protein [Rhodocyclaceae bacterium]